MTNSYFAKKDLLRCFLIFWLVSVYAVVYAQPIQPITYSPAIKQIEANGDKCGLQLYVSTLGNDNSTGRKPTPTITDGPFLTLERAKDEVRRLIESNKLPAGGVAINIVKGDYPIIHSLEFDEFDSGSNKAPIIYRAYKDEEVHIVGGMTINADKFLPVTDPVILRRIDAAANGKILQLDTKSMGLTHTSAFPEVFNDGGGIFEIFVNDNRLPISRWPDEGNTTIKEVVNTGDKNTPGSFTYRGDRPKRWMASKDIWLKGFWRVGWEEPAIKVAKIDTSNHQITFKAGLPAGIGSKYQRPKGSGKEEWYAINLLEEITRPGEWCIDFNTGIVYLWPPDNFKQSNIVISQLDKPVITAKNLANTAFIGITIKGSLGDGIVIDHGENDLIAGCVFKNLAGNGVILNGTNCGIQSCDMFGLGKGCIAISGGNREKLIESGNYVINNHLHHYGVLRSQYSAAIDLYSETNGAPAVGILVAHNLIHHAPRDGILYAGEKNVFEYNDIYRCAYATADDGAFYSWMDWTIRGLIIRFNYIHNTVGGVNPDDGASGTFVYGNIFWGNRTGVWIASGPDHTIENNIFIKNEGPVFGMDDRGKARGYATNKNIISKVKSVNPGFAPWSTTFPEMNSLLESHPELPIRTRFLGNIIWIKKGNPVSIKMSKENLADTSLLKMANNFVTSDDPGFVDFSRGDLTLQKNAPAYNKIPGFPKINFKKMGLYIDKYRKRLPTAKEAGKLPSQNPWKGDDNDTYFGT